jgi:hypothetical protein
MTTRECFIIFVLALAGVGCTAWRVALWCGALPCSHACYWCGQAHR